MSLEPGSLIDERYRVISPLGEGGMGAVYIVEHIAMRKRMALKVLHREMGDNAEVLARFEREAIAAAHVDHPNVAAASDFGRTADGQFFMVLEYIDGKSLRAAEDEGGPMTEARAVALTKQITSALVRAHDQGVVHRDLKPENVMLVLRDGAEQVKVLDFGIAKLHGELAASNVQPGGHPLTKLGVVFGTPEYISPEQALGQAVDARADLYAVGVMLFEMLAGKRPFEADEQVRLLLMHANDPPPRLGPLAPHASAELCAIVMRLLEKEPNARFPDAKTLLAALEGLTLGETPSPVSLGISAPVSAVGPTIARTSAPTIPRTTSQHLARVAGLRDAWMGKLPPAVRAIPRPALVAAGLALLVVPALLLLLLVVAPLRHGTSAAGPSGSVVLRPVATARGISDGDVTKAATGGSSELERLAAKAPSDPRIQHALVVAYVHEDRNEDAMRALGKWAEADPAAGKSADAESAVLSAATGTPADLDAAMAVMEGPLGAAGVDLMLDLQAKPGMANATKTRLNQSLAKPEVRSHASPAASLALDIKAAKTCEARYALLDQARIEGDARVLAVLKPMEQKSGCGFLGRRDCWSCMRKDTALDDAISAIEKRK
ncbi:MAG TPA: protein kinase [Polyangiaceae bacterium]